MASADGLDAVAELVASLQAAPEQFFTPSQPLSTNLTQAAKTLFDLGKKNASKPIGVLPNLLVDGFDSEQIWQELQMEHEPLLKALDAALDKSAQVQGPAVTDTVPPRSRSKRQNETEAADAGEDDNEDDEGDEDQDSDRFDEGEGDDSEAQNLDDDEAAFRAQVGALTRGFGSDDEADEGEGDDAEGDEAEEADEGDDGSDDGSDTLDGFGSGPGSKAALNADGEVDFFSLDDMDKFADRTEADDELEADMDDEGDDEGDEGDEEGFEFGDDEGDEGDDDAAPGHGKKMLYQDFFDKPAAKRKGGKHAQDQADDDEEEEPEETLSTFEKKQRAMRKKIAAIEEKIVRPRDWDLTGEIDAQHRPADSLLETHLEFEHAIRPAPPVTAETTAELEDLIRHRIINEQWDDVVRKYDPYELGGAKAPATEVSDKKSAEGLGEIYEKEFMDLVRVKEGLGTAADEKLRAQHLEITQLFSQLCFSLDSLCNFHFTPRPPKEAELTTVSKAAAISMEEVVPMGVSDAQLAAPKEVFAPGAEAKHADGAAARDELSHDEKQRRHRAKKRQAHNKRVSKDNEEKARAASLGPDSRAARRLSDKKALAAVTSSRNVKHGVPVANATSGGKLTNSTSFFSQLQSSEKAAAKKKSGKGTAAAAASSSSAPSKAFKL